MKIVNLWSLVVVFNITVFVTLLGHAQIPNSKPVEGLQDNTPSTTVLRGGRIVVSAEQIIENGDVIIQDNLIRKVGENQRIPAGAKIIELDGRTVYAGFIDAYSPSNVDRTPAFNGAPYWNDTITPQLSVADVYQSDSGVNSQFRSQGITARVVAPSNGIIRGTGSLVATGTGENDTAILKADVFQHFRLTVPQGRGRDQYPNSPMGAVAIARQSMMDAAWYAKAWEAHQSNPGNKRPERNDALAAMAPLLNASQTAVFITSDEQYFLRADRFAKQFGLEALIVGSGYEYQRLNHVVATQRSIILPVDFPQAPNVGSIESARAASLESMMHWDLAPENPGRLARAGVKIALTSYGLKDKNDFLKNVRRSIQRGLTEQAALASLTTVPAELVGMGHILGKVEKNYLANLVVVSGNLFEESSKIDEVWVAGERFEFSPTPLLSLNGSWSLEGDLEGTQLTLELNGDGPGLDGSIHIHSEQEKTSVALTKASIRDTRLSAVLPGVKFEKEGAIRFTLTFLDTEAQHGVGEWAATDGSTGKFTAKLMSAEKPKGDVEKPMEDKPKTAVAASFDVNYPLGAYGRSTSPSQAGLLLLTNATIWTSGPDGTLENASMLIDRGKIVAVGQELKAPRGATIVDLAGRHITAGIIDAHSHMGTDGGVNESAQAITAEVRIGDFINARDKTIYRQLAGGVTTSNILHGSANPIGGQNQVIKLRWGAIGEDLKFEDAPLGIKFALGENVKQSNWGDEYTTRYPQTRMGVEQIIRDAFLRARQYKKDWTQWNATKRGVPPRYDYELEAIVEILDHQRWIHCHSYRQDEILALLRTLEEFNVTIGTLQHILEGYKVAPEMAAHGAMGSTFADWWAYKYEVIDAIPYNGKLMHKAGVVVSFNSDDRELGRHLNHEAAKAVKYGGVEPDEALKFVTLNPAKQLRIDQFVGSLEAGKHADFVIWSGDPLSVFSRCEQTWIDGRKYFDRQEDIASRSTLQQRRNTLIQKILESGEEMSQGGTGTKKEADLWPREDVFCHTHRHSNVCNHAGQQGRLQQLMDLINQEQREQQKQQGQLQKNAVQQNVEGA
ncbi:MAG: amidohydrolase [Rhodopirellula sp.]|nr:amidohydrolase [Rhodopirellula sp.]|tara:strand:- start:18154 stop:21366 length:3213 start_codon:yes stop_codon:yes gene_type:complete